MLLSAKTEGLFFGFYSVENKPYTRNYDPVGMTSGHPTIVSMYQATTGLPYKKPNFSHFLKSKRICKYNQHHFDKTVKNTFFKINSGMI